MTSILTVAWLNGLAYGFCLWDKLPHRVKQGVVATGMAISLLPIIPMVHCGRGAAGLSDGQVGALNPAWRVLPVRLVTPVGKLTPLTKLLKIQRQEEHEAIKKSLLTIHVERLGHWQKAGSRQGPFCRVTCTVHHNDHYDVEALPELCKAGFIPKEMAEVPGWGKTAGDSEYEFLNPWPGPANPEGGFHSYKLYWSNK